LKYWLNAGVRRDRAFAGLFGDDEYDDVRAFYAAQADLEPTPLRSARQIARLLGLDTIDVKDESSRCGLTAFKILGVRYALHKLGGTITARGLVCATAGNHGRAVARAARERQIPCTIFVPSARTISEVERATRERRISAMTADGAKVIEVDGSYEEAVRRAAAFGDETGATILSDMSWPGYEQIPRWIMAGYTHMFEEAARQWERTPDVVIVQGGVGGLVCAAASWFAWRFGAERPFIIACEPDDAACLLESARAGAPVSIGAGMKTIMAGLRCAEPSPVAWPVIAAAIDAFVSVPDSLVIDAMEQLQREDPPITAGPSGACGVAGLMAIARAPELEAVRSGCAMDSLTHALVVVTEAP
jgi:diaminopropionate ammonia-lyase